MPAVILWYRRDLRLQDHPALCAAVAAAAGSGSRIVPVFVVDPRLVGPAGPARRRFLRGCLTRLDDDLDGRLLLIAGDPAEVVPALAGRIGAAEIHVSADFGPYGRSRDDRVAVALRADGRELVATGSPYAVSPGRVRTAEGSGYRVFTPYYRAWVSHGWRPPPAPDQPAPWAPPVGWRAALRPGPALDEALGLDRQGSDGPRLPEPGERAALARWASFRDGPLADYPRTRSTTHGSSRLSPYLRWGCLHPRTLLDGLAHRSRPGRADSLPAEAVESFRRELAWREFYADVLLHQPESARQALDRPAGQVRADHGDEADRRFDAWARGLTGYPLVDAGMRHLLAEAWLPNRLRMVVASFLVKDLHLPWERGARHFMHHLVDADLASNAHGWQWVAGTGTDAAPYHRVFNPVRQAVLADPDGDYVRRWVPELAGLPSRLVHEPWRSPTGLPAGYPDRIVDHAAERAEALARFAEVRDRP